MLFIDPVPDHLENFIEAQLQSHSAAGSHALEHDPCWLYRPEQTMGPLPHRPEPARVWEDIPQGSSEAQVSDAPALL